MSTGLPIIHGNYYQDILDQPRALEATLAGLVTSRDLLDLAARLKGGGFRRVLLTGMGSSYHGLNPLHLKLAGRGIASTLMETSELIHYGRALLDAETLVVAVSQSGDSAETVRLLEINQSRAPVIGLTNSPESRLASGCTVPLITAAGPEFSVSCKTYISALAALGWLGDILCGLDPMDTLRDMALAPALVAGILVDLDAKVAALAEELRGIRSLFMVGRGPSMASAGTGALITKEAARFHAEGMSSAAFRHGPMEMVHGNMHVLVFAGDPATRAFNERLLAEVLDHGGKGSLCDPRTPSERLRPILEIVHVHVLTLALAALAGTEAGAFKWASKVTITE